MKHLILFLSFAISAIPLWTQETTNGPRLNAEDGIAAKGYDVVSYFDGKPAKGNENLIKQYEGIIYQFQNEANLNTFNKDPEKYVPEFGGYCAYAIGDTGGLVDVDPETYKIVDGKLYLFYNSFFNNTLKKWNKDETELLRKANTNWKKH